MCFLIISMCSLENAYLDLPILIVLLKILSCMNIFVYFGEINSCQLLDFQIFSLIQWFVFSLLWFPCCEDFIHFLNFTCTGVCGLLDLVQSEVHKFAISFPAQFELREQGCIWEIRP